MGVVIVGVRCGVVWCVCVWVVGVVCARVCVCVGCVGVF